MSGRPLCEKCGKPHGPCKAHKRNVRPWEPCKSTSVREGANVCDSHGGRNPNTIKGAKFVREYNKAQELVATYGKPLEHNVSEGMLSLIFWSFGHVEWLRSKIQEHSAEDLVWGLSSQEESDDGVKSTEVASPSVWVKLYGEERDRYARLVKDAHSIGIEERRIKLAERYADHLIYFGNVVVEQVKAGLIKAGYVPEEIEEDFPVIMQEAVPGALLAMKELGA